jgi:kynurenine formamidase
MTTTTITQETAEFLVGKKIIEVGTNYIKLDNGLRIYLDESEIEDLNSFND